MIVTALLNLLKAKPDLVSWDDTGQVKIEGETIPQTNISIDQQWPEFKTEKNVQSCGFERIF